MANGNQHIVPNGQSWSVRRAGSSRVTSTHSTQREAIDHGRTIARNQNSELLIHGRNGRIRARDSYGNDPFPPRG